MGKYGTLIQQAKAEGQEARKPDNQTARKPGVKKARMAENRKTRKQESQEAGDLANLCVKVPLRLRRHWAAQSKLTGVSMTDVIIEALTRRFGKP
jgi:hypothetical protein